VGRAVGRVGFRLGFEVGALEGEGVGFHVVGLTVGALVLELSHRKK